MHIWACTHTHTQMYSVWTHITHINTHTDTNVFVIDLTLGKINTHTIYSDTTPSCKHTWRGCWEVLLCELQLVAMTAESDVKKEKSTVELLQGSAHCPCWGLGMCVHGMCVVSGFACVWMHCVWVCLCASGMCVCVCVCQWNTEAIIKAGNLTPSRPPCSCQPPKPPIL